jgi:hypothetical protein
MYVILGACGELSFLSCPKASRRAHYSVVAIMTLISFFPFAEQGQIGEKLEFLKIIV